MVNLNVIVLLITEGNFANVQKLYNDISKAELQDFDIIILDQVNSQNDLPTITFNKHDIPDKSVTNMLSPKGAWDYFPIWAHENKYEYYWVIEDLVHYSGDWTEFIQKYVPIECDLLTNGRGLPNSKWPWWRRQRNIYGRAVIEYPARNSKLYQTAFLPCSRFSRKLVEKGYKHLENNQKAFIEIFWSTICVKERLSVMNWNSEDIGEVTWKPKGEYTNVTKKGKLWYPVNKVENMNVKLNKQVVEFENNTVFFNKCTKLVYSCVFFNMKYIDLLEKLLYTFSKYGQADDQTMYLIMTNKNMSKTIKKIFLKYNINGSIWNINLNTKFESTYSRYKIFEYENIKQFSKIIYLDCDILITNSIHHIFDKDPKDKLLALYEHPHRHYHFEIFSESEYVLLDKTLAFTSGVLFFGNNRIIQECFIATINTINQYFFI